MKFHHYGLEVANLEFAKSFYIAYLHFHEELSMKALGEKLVFLKKGNFRIELVENDEGKGSHICFQVESIEKFLDQGLELIEGPFTLDNGWKTVFFRGPSDETLEFLQTENYENKMI